MNKVRSAVSKANKKGTVQLAAVLLASSTLISSALGLLREKLLNSLYYDTYKVGLDAYTVAFSIPDFMFFILVSGALSVTFIPVFNQRLGAGNKQSAWQLSSSMINFMALTTLAASILIIIFAEPLVQYVVGPGLDESGRNLAVSLMRVIAVNPFLFAVATVIASMQQAIGRFAFYALAPTIYNLGIIFGALFFTQGIEIFGWRIFDGGIMGVALGVVLGSIMQLLVSSIGLFGMGFDYNFKIYRKNKGFRKVLSLLPARSLDQGADYLNSLVEINLASHMAAGTIRAYQQAMTLHMVPINLIGVAISTAAFPEMTKHLSESREDLFKKELRKILRVIIWLGLPVATIAFISRGYLVNFIKLGGDPLMSGLLGALCIAILFRSIYHIAARSFYAMQDTKTPLYVSLVAISLNIILAIIFTTQMNLGAYGLAYAQSIVAALEVGILFYVMSHRTSNVFNKEFISAILKMILATTIVAVVCYILVKMLPLESNDLSFFAAFPKFMIIVSISLLAYVAASDILKLKEADPIIAKAKKIFFGKVKI